jgi:DNA repair exonuclease SbcCD ATPase subunit
MSSEYDKKYYADFGGKRWVLVEYANKQLAESEKEISQLRADKERLEADKKTYDRLLDRNHDLIDYLGQRLQAAERRLHAIQSKVNEQSEDDGLWIVPRTLPEAYLQDALRTLHEVIEGKTSEECAMQKTIQSGEKK